MTLPDFDIRTTDPFEKKATAELFLFAPIVQQDERSSFVKYAQDNQGWIESDLKLRGLGDVDPGTISDTIWSFTGDEADILEGFSVPLWQMSPVPTDANLILMDMYTQASFSRMIDDAVLVEHVLLSEIVRSDFLTDSVNTIDRDPARAVHPRSYAVEPVFDQFENSGLDRNLVGFIFTVVPWDAFFVDSLRGTVLGGVVVNVITNCDEDFYYEVEGDRADYLGTDFSPDSRYADLMVESEFAEFARYNDGQSDLEDAEDSPITHCEYKLRVYPTPEFESQYQTSRPAVFATVVVLVFVFTALVFGLYDFFVQRRQNVIMNSARRTAAVVSSLFPQNVQNRILQQDNAEDLKQMRRSTFSAKHHLKTFLRGGADEPDPSGESGATYGVFKTKPIADLFLVSPAKKQLHAWLP